MREAARSEAPKLYTDWEGRIDWMYLDKKGNVTTAIGCRIRSAEEAATLDFFHDESGADASPDEKRATWRLVRDSGVTDPVSCKNIPGNDLRLRDVDALTSRRIDSFDNQAAVVDFPPSDVSRGYSVAPADAQLAVNSYYFANGSINDPNPNVPNDPHAAPRLRAALKHDVAGGRKAVGRRSTDAAPQDANRLSSSAERLVEQLG